MKPRHTKVPCPVCGGRGIRDNPKGYILQATCTVCGWHYTTRLRLPKREVVR